MVNPSLIATINPFFPLNPIENFISKHIKESKFDEVFGEVATKHDIYFASSFMLKSIQPSVDGYITGFVKTCEKFEEVYSMVFVDKFVPANET